MYVTEEQCLVIMDCIGFTKLRTSDTFRPQSDRRCDPPMLVVEEPDSERLRDILLTRVKPPVTSSEVDDCMKRAGL